jgi:uncharacterized protein YjaZ
LKIPEEKRVTTRMNRFVFLLTLFGVLGCQTKTVEFERTKAVIKNQKFEFLTTYRLFENYIAQQKNSDYVSGSNEFLYEPIQREILKNAEAAFMFETIQIPYQPGALLEKELSVLKNSDVVRVAKEALEKITSALPGPDTKIIFMPTNPVMHDLFSKYNVCINAITVGSGKIIVQIDPTFPQWREMLPRVIAHEYHHSVWMARHWKNADFSVLEYLIFEGRADAFAASLYSNVTSPWTAMINREQERFVWKKIEPELFERGRGKINAVLLADPEIPAGSVYTIGFNIIRSFKQENPKYTDREIIDLKPEDIFKMSKYQ